MARVKLDLPESPVFAATVPVRITDLNYGGHVGNDSMLSILHEARVQFLTHFGFTERNIGGRGIIMSDAVIIYKSEVFYGTTLTIELGVTDLYAHGTDLTYRVLDGEKEIARAKTGIVFFDYEKRKIAQMPEEFKSLFVPHT
ncbi:MAG: thioesterase family protein [Ignavibacteriales bacterium]|nr:thioesterase family protein [Ignavibacteriales bacterium]